MDRQLAEYASSNGRQDERTEAETDAAIHASFDMVDEAFGCPLCGNCVMDKLIWSSDYEHITCAACGITYTPRE